MGAIKPNEEGHLSTDQKLLRTDVAIAHELNPRLNVLKAPEFPID